jgi:hypothetical protein
MPGQATGDLVLRGDVPYSCRPVMLLKQGKGTFIAGVRWWREGIPMRWPVVLLGVLIVGLSGCTNSSPASPSPSPTLNVSPLPAAATGLRGVPVESVTCPPDSGPTQPKPVTKVDSPTELAVCFEHEPVTSSEGPSYISLKTGDAPFWPVAKALTQPDIPTPRPVDCPSSQQTPIYVYGLSGEQWFRLTVPTDRCGSYREAAKAALGPMAWGVH